MGQITTDSYLGSWLLETCRSRNDINNVVEIGTWDGMGSTYCIVEGLLRSGRSNLNFISLETNQQMHSGAESAWSGKLPQWARLVHGRVVDETEMDSYKLIGDEGEWFKQDLSAMRSCPNVLDQIPATIDLLLLDGGEFTTKSEYLKLKNRSRIVVLDDTNERKCRWIRESVTSSPQNYRILIDMPNIRLGVMAFEVIQ